MAFWTSSLETLTSTFRHGRLWLAQFFGNLLLFAGIVGFLRLDVATAMLDARLVGGDGALSMALRERLWEWVRRPSTRFVDRLRAAAEERVRRFGSASQRLEPDVKEGSGGQ